MTEKLYYKDVYIKEFEAEVISCTAVKNKYEVILDKTAFFPEGGGQPGDRGFIEEAAVLDTVENGEDIIHICDRAVSGKVKCRLNWDFRFANMQQHSGEHIFSGITHSITGFDNVGFHMGENEITVDFNGVIDDDTLIEIEKRTNKVIYENRKINIILPSRDELSSYNYRSKKELTGQVRLVEIEGADLCACCGTHVSLTGEIGIVKIITCMNFRQGVRITLKIGSQAFDDYVEKNRNVYAVSASLCAKADEIPGAVEKLKERLSRTYFELENKKKELFEILCSNVNEEFPVVFYDKGSADDARVIADIMADKVRIAYAFCGNDETGYRYAAVSRTENLRETGKELNAALEGRGGGKPECIMGSVKANRESIIKYFEK